MSKKKQPEQAETEQTEAKQASEEKTEQPAEAKTPAADWEAKYNDLNDRHFQNSGLLTLSLHGNDTQKDIHR